MDRLQPLPLDRLTAWIADELQGCDAILGLPRVLSFRPAPADPFRTAVHGHPLETPFGVAAGPHSQMAQGIVFAWLCGARVVELKTVQTLDEITLPRPCIDMRDEGYNVEWSQELKVEQSLAEYLHAWVLVHALHRRLGFPGERPGVVFDVSVGYDLEGLRRPNMQAFLERVRDGRKLRDRAVATVSRFLPEVAQVEIPPSLSDSVTLSTMHGCPPEEIGRIATFLMREWGFHTSVKLNPTLLGPERVRNILHDRLGWRHVTVPDQAFAHDLEYRQALDLVRELQGEAARWRVDFGVKLSNTLQVEHRGDLFDPGETTMYLSGRALHALTVCLAAQLAEDLGGSLAVSFAGGADAFSAPRLLAAGMRTVTACSDLLRPGGCTRLLHYLETTREALERAGAADLEGLVVRTAAAREGASLAGHLAPGERVRACALANLRRYAVEVLTDPALHRDAFDRAHARTSRELGRFDCIAAPCTAECPLDQKVPDYLRLVAERRFAEAAAVIRQDNPLPAILGRACTRRCEGPCLRTHYDEPLAIRAVKRFVVEQAGEVAPSPRPAGPPRARVAVIGGGPCGLAVASFLAPAGYAVTLFERQPFTGGMVAGAIPGFRADPSAIEQDLARVASPGVELRLGVEVGRDPTFATLRQGFDFVVVAAGAQEGARLGIEGERSGGVLDGLELLRAVRRGSPPRVGLRVGVVGGGDVAIDCARTARRLGAREVTVIYRRSAAQMPAQREELAAARAEGVELLELAAPRRVIARGGRLAAVVCARMRLGEPDASGRPRPLEVPGADFQLALDSLVVAVGQQARLDFLAGTPVELDPHGFVRADPETLETSLAGVFAGGDAVREGPATIVRACGDGRRIAAEIRRRVEGFAAPRPALSDADVVDLLARRARRLRRAPTRELPAVDRDGIAQPVDSLSADGAVQEAARCLDCDRMCSTCVSVCPNRALLTYRCRGLRLPVPTLERRGTDLVLRSSRPFVVEQPFQVAVLAELCNQCGNCVTFCPTRGRPYRDKPRLFLSRTRFEAERDNAFRVLRGDGTAAIEARCAGETHRLVLGAELRYRSPWVEAVLDGASFALREASLRGALREGEALPLEQCAIMLTVLEGVVRLEPQLPLAEWEQP